MSDPTDLAATLRSTAPGTRLELTWDDTATQPTTTGIVTEVERGQADRRIETDDRILQLTHTCTNTVVTNVTVTEITLEGATDLGPLQELAVIDRPTEQLRLTDAGVEVPPYYVGYDGFLTVIDSQGRQDSRMLGGLEPYDDRLLTGICPLAEPYEDDIVEIAPWGGPTRVFEIVDQRTPPDDSQRLEGPPVQATPATAHVAATHTPTTDPARPRDQSQN